MAVESALRQLSDAGNDEVGRLLLRAVRSANEQIVERLRSRGHPAVRLAHTAVFTNLDPAGTRAAVLAQRAHMTRQAMSGLVRELQAAGYVEVHPDATDGRAALVSLTPLGEKFCTDAAAVISEIEAEWAERLGDPHLQRLRAALHALIEVP